jgi:hypothetical protein
MEPFLKTYVFLGSVTQGVKDNITVIHRRVLLSQQKILCRCLWSRGSSGSIVSGYGLNNRVIEVRSPTGADFFLAPASRPALGPTQPPIQWVLGGLSPGIKRGRGVKLTTHPYLVPRLRMSRSYTSSPLMCVHGM